MRTRTSLSAARRQRADLAQRAVGAGRDDDDLRRRRAAPGEGADVLAVGDDEQHARPAPAADDGAAALRAAPRADRRRTNAFAKAGSTCDPSDAGERRGVDAAAPRRAEHAVDRDALGAQARRRRRAPRRGPRSLRLRCVVQSSRRQPAGSPTPGASPWRISATTPPWRSAAQAAASSARADPVAKSRTSERERAPGDARGALRARRRRRSRRRQARAAQAGDERRP